MLGSPCTRPPSGCLVVQKKLKRLHANSEILFKSTNNILRYFGHLIFFFIISSISSASSNSSRSSGSRSRSSSSGTCVQGGGSL